MTNEEIEGDLARPLKGNERTMTIEDIRARAAIAALPKCIDIVGKVMMPHGGLATNDAMVAHTATMACKFADALVKKFTNKKL